MNQKHPCLSFTDEGIQELKTPTFQDVYDTASKLMVYYLRWRPWWPVCNKSHQGIVEDPKVLY